MSQTALWFFFGVTIFLSVCGNLYTYFGIATEEDRPDARGWYYSVNGYWSLMNIGVVALLVWKCFA